MKTNSDKPITSHNGRTIAGVIILAIGGLLLIDQFDLNIVPHWLFSWPLILIAVGLYLGFKHDFKNRGWIIMVGLGLAFMLNNALPGLFISQLIWPGVIIAIGIFMIMKHSSNYNQHNKTVKL